MTKWIGIADLAELTEGVMSAPGIKKAAQTGRLNAKKNGRAWLVDADSEIARGWIAEAKAKSEPSDIESLRAEIEKLTRENAQLGKRVRQAEAAQRRADREVAKLRVELAEAYRTAADQADKNAQKMFELTQRSNEENTRMLLKVAQMITNGTQPKPEILAGEMAPEPTK